MVKKNNSVIGRYTYDSDGMRITKTTAEGPTTYHVMNGVCYGETRSNGQNLQYVFDENGRVIGFRMQFDTGSIRFYFVFNAQGDVVQLLDSWGNVQANYSYDTWGRCTATDSNGNALSSDSIGMINPFRYRGYYYDNETGLYYLQSRYYDPVVGRFLNADSQLNPQQGSIGCNMFAYCGNNPVSKEDPTGHAFMFVTAAIGAVVGAVAGGIIAAKEGKNVWAGIGIGAAAGGLIGLGAGAAASAVLAGSITASTATVMSGGAALVSTIGSGGLGAGATFLANNLSQTFGNGGGQVVAQTAQAGKNVYYQVTSSQSAQIIAETGKIISREGGSHSLVYALNFQPTLSQARQLGAHSVETVIRFTTNAPFEPDHLCSVSGALRSIIDSPINVFDVVEVGFR